jgi:hypothetical protein
MKGFCASIILAGALLTIAAPAPAAVIWDESIHGDLSSDHTTPSGPVNLALGSNELHGTTISGDRDYATIVVPAGLELSQLVVLELTGDNLAFIALQAGSQVTDPGGADPAADLLGYTHVGSSAGNIGTDVLDDMSTAAGAQGFTPPLPAGTYSVWIQETGGVEVTYGFDFVLTQVPAPGALGLFIVAGLARRRRRR